MRCRRMTTPRWPRPSKTAPIVQPGARFLPLGGPIHVTTPVATLYETLVSSQSREIANDLRTDSESDLG